MSTISIIGIEREFELFWVSLGILGIAIVACFILIKIGDHYGRLADGIKLRDEFGEWIDENFESHRIYDQKRSNLVGIGILTLLIGSALFIVMTAADYGLQRADNPVKPISTQYYPLTNLEYNDNYSRYSRGGISFDYTKDRVPEHGYKRVEDWFVISNDYEPFMAKNVYQFGPFTDTVYTYYINEDDLAELVKQCVEDRF